MSVEDACTWSVSLDDWYPATETSSRAQPNGRQSSGSVTRSPWIRARAIVWLDSEVSPRRTCSPAAESDSVNP